jgi:hypothetical protein
MLSANMTWNFYADDTHIYISFKSSEAELAKSKIEECSLDIDQWMSQNMFKMNRDKTELMVLSARHRPAPPITSVSICDEVIEPSNTAKNIGVTFDSFMSMHMESHINTNLRNMSRIRKYTSHCSLLNI